MSSIGKMTKLAGIALAASLALANMSPANAGSASIPLYGPYVISTKLACGGGSSGSIGTVGFLDGNGWIVVDASDTYSTWLRGRGAPDPTNLTRYSSLGFNSNAMIRETPVQWGRMDYVQYQTSAGDPSRAVGGGPIYFIVTSYGFPAVIDTYSHSYLMYLYFATSASISWHQAPLAVNNPGSTATVASAVFTLGISPSSCVAQNEWHK